MNKLAFMLLHFRNRMFWSFISPILIGFLTFYGNQRSLFRNTGITWLNCIWNVFVLMWTDEQICFHAFPLWKSNILERYFAILIGFLKVYGNQRSLFRNSGITWLNCIWNVFVLMWTDEQISFHAFPLSKSNILERYFAILIVFIKVYGNQRTLFRNSVIMWLNCIWNVFVLMWTDEQIGFQAFAPSKSNVLELYFANFDWFFNVLR